MESRRDGRRLSVEIDWLASRIDVPQRLPSLRDSSVAGWGHPIPGLTSGATACRPFGTPRSRGDTRTPDWRSGLRPAVLSGLEGAFSQWNPRPQFTQARNPPSPTQAQQPPQPIQNTRLEADRSSVTTLASFTNLSSQPRPPWSKRPPADSLRLAGGVRCRHVAFGWCWALPVGC